MAESESTEPVGLGFSPADAKAPVLHLDAQVLTLRFEDWHGEHVTVTCHDTIAVRWQEADWYVDEGDRFDGTFAVRNSAWLAEHTRQGVPFGDKPFRHLKMNFNAAGILEVLCTTTSVDRTTSS